MIKCKKGELENFEKLKICRYNNPSFENEIELNKKGRKIIEINKNNKISTFVSIFDDDVINNEDFIDSEYFNDYKEHIDKLINKEKNDKKKRKIICIVLTVIVSLILFISIVVWFYNYKYGEKILREEEDDNQLKTSITIRDMNYKEKDREKVILYYNNDYLKYIGPFKNYGANGIRKYYSKDYKNKIIYEGNFENGFPNGHGKIYYYEGNKEIGYYDGSWVYSKRSGKGEIKYKDGDMYIGDFENDVKEGGGKYIYNDHYYYEGGYKNDERHGQGKVCNSKDEIICEGNFIKNKYQKSFLDYLKVPFISKRHCY
jgi:hypothetical protein